jgi:hypothetical protein
MFSSASAYFKFILVGVWNFQTRVLAKATRDKLFCPNYPWNFPNISELSLYSLAASYFFLSILPMFHLRIGFWY